MVIRIHPVAIAALHPTPTSPLSFTLYCSRSVLPFLFSCWTPSLRSPPPSPVDSIHRSSGDGMKSFFTLPERSNEIFSNEENEINMLLSLSLIKVRNRNVKSHYFIEQPYSADSLLTFPKIVMIFKI